MHKKSRIANAANSTQPVAGEIQKVTKSQVRKMVDIREYHYIYAMASFRNSMLLSSKHTRRHLNRSPPHSLKFSKSSSNSHK